LIDHSREFTDRAVELSKNFKMDFATVRDVQGRAITLGDIVGHNIPVNSFGQILGYFDTLLGKPARPLLETAVDRWQTEIEKKPSEPIIQDFDALAKLMSRLVEIRHILCHELPEKPVYAVDDVAEFLEAALRFTKAIEWVLTFEKFGLVPLTQTDMNIAEGNRFRSKEEELNNLFAKIRQKIISLDRDALGPRTGDSAWGKSFEEAQEKWRSYRNAYCDFVTYLNKGGTIRPLIWAGEAIRMTEARIAEIQGWFEFESRRLAFEPEESE
jgi:uncharacterized protein YecT (DUF1311 family)